MEQHSIIGTRRLLPETIWVDKYRIRKIDWWIFSPVYRREQNKHRKWINKVRMRKLPVGQRLHARESKHDERYCSCWAESKTEDHLLRCPKRARHWNEIYKVIKRLEKEMDPVLWEILLDDVTKYLTRTRQGNTSQIIGIGFVKPQVKYQQTQGTSTGNFKRIRKQLDGSIY